MEIVGMGDGDLSEGPLCRRRAVLGVGLAVAPWLISSAGAQDATSMPPQPGDHLVFLTGPKQGQPVRSDDLQIDAVQVQAYPADPNGTVRDGSRLNLVILARLGTDGVSEETRARMADGVVAYSGVCTHQACPVNMWSEDLHAFVCSCHGSVYDPKNGAEVIAGPAPRHLAALPLKSERGMLMVAGGFVGRVGMQSS
jgi:rieske iron-sulfur protein